MKCLDGLTFHEFIMELKFKFGRRRVQSRNAYELSPEGDSKSKQSNYSKFTMNAIRILEEMLWDTQEMKYLA